MKRWTHFLNSIATAGGNLVLLYSLVLFLLVADIVQVCRHGGTNPDISSFAKDGFIALIAILSGRNSPAPPAGGGTTLSTNSKNIEVKPA